MPGAQGAGRRAIRPGLVGLFHVEQAGTPSGSRSTWNTTERVGAAALKLGSPHLLPDEQRQERPGRKLAVLDGSEEGWRLLRTEDEQPPGRAKESNH